MQPSPDCQVEPTPPFPRASLPPDTRSHWTVAVCSMSVCPAGLLAPARQGPGPPQLPRGPAPGPDLGECTDGAYLTPSTEVGTGK